MSGSTRRLLRGGVIAGPLFVATALIEGGVRPNYRPLRHPVSSLALGPRGWLQVANFLVTGALYTGCAIGLFRSADRVEESRAVPILVGGAAVGLLGAGTFRTDPVSGYPPGTADLLTDRTPPGLLHDLFSVPTFLGLPAAALVDARRAWRRGDRWWAVYSAKSAAIELATFFLASGGFAQSPRLVDRAGLFQRIFVGTAFGWITALTVRRLRLTT